MGMKSKRLTMALLGSLLFGACLAETDEGGDEGDVHTDLAERCSRPTKVKICHVPPGNPANAHTIEVSQSAVPAHLAHGDGLGPCVCPPGEEWDCYSAPLDTDGIGTCQRGTKTCSPDGTGYGACVGEIVPVPEVCGDGLDNDCDGSTDEGCTTVCTPGESVPCYSGPAGTEGVGVCMGGYAPCAPDGSGYGACSGEILPGTGDSCGDGLDNDCDGAADEGCCVAVPEVCGDGLDNDCDGDTDEGCVCAPGSMAPCYSGPAGTSGVGACHGGTMVCAADGSGYGACGGEVVPTADVCGDGIDNDCDGASDETCVCVPGSMAPCYTGPAGTSGVGACHGGTTVCAADGSGYGACGGEVTPTSETCGDGVDNDCDGAVDEGCIGDRAWNDADRDGLQDTGEVPLAGVTFFLRSASTGALIAVATSNVVGTYYFSGVPAGTYFIEVLTPFGFTLSDPNAGLNDNVDSDFDSESGGFSDTFTFGGGTDYRWDAGFYSIIQS